jgi:uncharacterized protein YdcH (DUF465 family)
MINKLNTAQLQDLFTEYNKLQKEITAINAIALTVSNDQRDRIDCF